MDWNIGRPGEECHRCRKPFDDKETYFSSVEIKNTSIHRSDYCQACFESDEEAESKVFWRTKMPESAPAKRTVNFEVLRELLYKMLDVDEQEIIELAYFIALILIRKRYLRLKDFVTEKGQDFMAVQEKKGTPVIMVKAPLVEDEDIIILRDKLGGFLDADLDSGMEISELRDVITNAQQGAPPQEPS